MRVIDSHTEGEPTRLIVEGGPDLGRGPLAERRRLFAERLRRRSRTSRSTSRAGSTRWSARCLCEPATRPAPPGLSSSTMPAISACAGTATIGAAVSLAHMGRLRAGRASLRDAGRDRRRSSCTTATRRPSRTCRATCISAASNSAGRRRQRRRRLGRQLVLPDRRRALRARRRAIIPELTAAALAIKAQLDAAWRCEAMTAARSTMSSFSVAPAWRAPTAAISCSAPAAPTTARPAAPGPAPSSPVSRRWRTGAGRALGAGEHDRRPLLGRYSASPTAASRPASPAAPGSRRRRRWSAIPPILSPMACRR